MIPQVRDTVVQYSKTPFACTPSSTQQLYQSMEEKQTVPDFPSLKITAIRGINNPNNNRSDGVPDFNNTRYEQSDTNGKRKRDEQTNLRRALR